MDGRDGEGMVMVGKEGMVTIYNFYNIAVSSG